MLNLVYWIVSRTFLSWQPSSSGSAHWAKNGALRGEKGKRRPQVSAAWGGKGVLGLLSLYPRWLPFGLCLSAHVAAEAGSRTPFTASVLCCSLPFLLPGRHLPCMHLSYGSAASPQPHQWSAGLGSSLGAGIAFSVAEGIKPSFLTSRVAASIPDFISTQLSTPPLGYFKRI